MQEVTLTIDSIKVTVPEDYTILQACRQADIEIPTLCEDKSLIPFGGCRLCAVEIEGGRKLAPSCSTKVAKDMIINTASEKVVKNRRLIIELLLADHPLDCMTCQKSGDCKLQQYAYEYGLEKSRFFSTSRSLPIDDANGFIIRDYNKCLLCRKCVRMCREINGAAAIDVSARGYNTLVGVPFNKPLNKSDCLQCGMCIDVCPVGALTANSEKGAGRAWDQKKVQTTCVYCGVGCQLNVKLNSKNEIIGVEGADCEPNNRQLCVKGRFGWDFVYSKERLKTPLIKENGSFREATWDEAYDLILEKFNSIRSKYGNDSLEFLSSAKCTNEENYLLQKLARMVFRTNNVDHCARLCHSSTVAGLATTLGSGAMTNSIGEIESSELIWITGSNTTEMHPVIGYRIKRAKKYNGAKIIVADPRKIELVKYADLWLRHKPGTDVALYNGMVHVIIREGLYDKEYVNERCEGFDELKEAVAEYTPELVSKITTVPAGDIEKAARMYAEAGSASIFYAMGITQSSHGVDNVFSLSNLAAITGNFGKESCGVNPLRGQNNVQGACDMGALPNIFSGYQSVTDSANREKMMKAWGVENGELPSKPGYPVTVSFNAILEGKLKGMYIFAENPMMSDPDLGHVEKALRKLDFLVVQDIFLTETAMLADVVLPGTSFLEKDGTFTSTERRVQRVRKAIKPLNGTKPDWQIIVDIADKFGCKWNYNSPSDIMDEIASVTPSYGGISFARLESDGLHWPCPAKDHPGTKFLHKGKFTRGKALLKPLKYREAIELPDEDYPFLLSTGRILYHWHTGTMTRRVKAIEDHRPHEMMELNPADAKRLGVDADGMVRVTSRRGSVVTRVNLTDRVSEGMVFMTFHFREACANLLTNAESLDPVAKIPEYKVCAVKVEKA